MYRSAVTRSDWLDRPHRERELSSAAREGIVLAKLMRKTGWSAAKLAAELARRAPSSRSALSMTQTVRQARAEERVYETLMLSKGYTAAEDARRANALGTPLTARTIQRRVAQARDEIFRNSR